ncbi:MAG: hypothetical protein C0401_08865 [Anaerolinea sp.]|nr:hypothetical protein [Anaerolinea sp.]
MKKFLSHNKLALSALIVLITMLFGTMVHRLWEIPDYPSHTYFAFTLATLGYVDIPHYLYEQLVLVVRALLPINYIAVINTDLMLKVAKHSYELASIIVLVVFYCLLAFLLYNRLRQGREGEAYHRYKWVDVCLVMGLLLIAPINLFTLNNHQLYLGYIAMNVYHNPTVTLLKPLALLLFWVSMDKLDKDANFLDYVFIVFLTILATMTKPNYILCFLPATGVLLFKAWISKQKINSRYLILGVYLPALAILVIQYLLRYLGSPDEGIIFAPFQGMLHYDLTIAGLVAKFFLSIAFPLVMLVLNFKSLSRVPRFQAVWLAFLMSVILTYGFAETGDAANNGNFSWGSQVTLYILWVESFFFFLEQVKAAGFKTLLNKIRLLAPFGLAALHLASGVVWYVLEYAQPQMWWGILR